jgi:hypothetical protein
MPVIVNKNELRRITSKRIKKSKENWFGRNRIAVLAINDIVVRLRALVRIYFSALTGVIKRLCSTFCCFSSNTTAPTKVTPSRDVSKSIITRVVYNLGAGGKLKRIRR